MPEITSSQFTSTVDKDKPETTATGNQPAKADEHGIQKDEKTGSALAANSTSANPKPVNPIANKVGVANKPTASVSAAKPNNQAVTAPKTAATNPAKLSDGKIGATGYETELDGADGVAVRVKRSDGVTMQFPFSFREKQDLHQVKNMFDLMNKMVNLPEDKLREEFPSFVLD